MRDNRKLTKGSKVSAAVNSAEGPKGWRAVALPVTAEPRGTQRASSVVEACTYELTADSQLGSFGAQELPTIPKTDGRNIFIFRFQELNWPRE